MAAQLWSTEIGIEELKAQETIKTKQQAKQNRKRKKKIILDA